MLVDRRVRGQAPRVVENKAGEQLRTEHDSAGEPRPAGQGRSEAQLLAEHIHLGEGYTLVRRGEST